MMQGRCATNVAKIRTVVLGQVKETGNGRAELKEGRGARVRGGVCLWERTEMCLLSKKK